MTLNEIYDALRDFRDASFCVNGQIEQNAKKALEALKEYRWRPVLDGDGELPKVDEDGYSDLVLLSFGNTKGIIIGQYREDELGGSFYEGETGDEPLTKFGLIVNAWAPLPESYREES